MNHKVWKNKKPGMYWSWRRTWFRNHSTNFAALPPGAVKIWSRTLWNDIQRYREWEEARRRAVSSQ